MADALVAIYQKAKRISTDGDDLVELLRLRVDGEYSCVPCCIPCAHGWVTTRRASGR